MRYYQLMIELAQHDADYLNICKYYHAVFNTPAVQEDPVKWHEVWWIIIQMNDQERTLIYHTCVYKYQKEVL